MVKVKPIVTKKFEIQGHFENNYHFWTIRIRTQTSRSAIFNEKSSLSREALFDPLLEDFTLVVVKKNEFQNLDVIIDNRFGRKRIGSTG